MFYRSVVEIQKNVKIEMIVEYNRIHLYAKTLLSEITTFVGHGVMFNNDRFKEGLRASQKNKLESILIGNNVNIGTNSTILPVKISDNATTGAASLVFDDINLKGIYYGNPIKEKIRLFDLHKNNQVYKKEFLKKPIKL